MPAWWDMHLHVGGGPAVIEDAPDLPPLLVVHGDALDRDQLDALLKSVAGRVADRRSTAPAAQR